MGQLQNIKQFISFCTLLLNRNTRNWTVLSLEVTEIFPKLGFQTKKVRLLANQYRELNKVFCTNLSIKHAFYLYRSYQDNLKLYPRSVVNDCNSFRSMCTDTGNLIPEIQDNLNNHQLPHNKKIQHTLQDKQGMFFLSLYRK